MKSKNKLDIFLNNLVKSFGSLQTKEFWPLNPSQILAYYNADFLLDFYLRWQYLKKNGKNKKQIAEMFENSDLLIDFLVNFACIGFKVLDKLNIYKVSFAKREEFFDEMFELMKLKDGNFFHLNLEKTKLQKRLSFARRQDFVKADAENKTVLNCFKVALFGLNWSLFYDLFAIYGSTTDWPSYFEFKEKKFLLLVDCFYNQKPAAVWPVTQNSPIEKVMIIRLFEPFKFQQNVFGRLATVENINKKLKYFQIFVNDRLAKNSKKIKDLTGKIMRLSAEQTGYVEKLKPLQQVGKAIDLTYFAYRKFFGSNWKQLAETVKKRNFKILGLKFIKQGTETTDQASLAEKKKIFDPRNNYFQKCL